MQLIEAFDWGAKVFPDRDCFATADGTLRLSYRDVSDLTHRIAVALADGGARPERRVAVLSPNDPMGFIAALGALRLNATWVATNPRDTAESLTTLLADANCEFLVYHSELTDAAAHVLDRVPSIELSVSIGPGRPGDPELSSWMAPAGSRAADPADEPDLTCLMLGTGGTTGRSKIVQLTHRNMLAVCYAFVAHMPEDHPVQLMAAPMSHAAGVITFPIFLQGGTSIVHSAVHAEKLLRSIEQDGVTRLFLPPTAIYNLLAHHDVRSFDYSSLKYLIYAAAPMSVEKLKEAIDVFGPVMTQTFGQAEAPMICTFFGPQDHADVLSSGNERRLCSCGRASVVARVEIAGEDGRLAAAGERGEIIVRGDLVMKGYFQNPEQTAASRLDGWHRTGDIGYIDEDGYVYIVDRLRDTIISGGFNIYPSEIEQVIWSHKAVRDCAVIGLPHEKWGEQVTAVIEPKEGAEIDPDEIISLCKQRLGSVKAPKEIIVRELPRSAVGKVLKRALRDEYWVGQDRAV